MRPSSYSGFNLLGVFISASQPPHLELAPLDPAIDQPSQGGISKLSRYRHMVADNIAIMFDQPSVDAIIRAFERVSSHADREHVSSSGCLMVNTVLEIDEPTGDITREVAEHRDLWRSTFQRALESDNIADAEARAEFLVGALWGALSQIRLAGDTRAAQPMTSIVIETVLSWTREH